MENQFGEAAVAAEGMGIVGYIMIAVLAIIGLVLFFGTFIIVKEKTAAVVTRFGKFARVAGTGLNVKLPIIEAVTGRLSLRVQQLPVTVETKTKDNVFVKIVVSVQFQVLADKVYEAFFRLQDPAAQMQAYVFDVVRAKVPELQLDAVFEKKEELAEAVKQGLASTMSGYGYDIVNSLVTDIEPDPKVKAAMNEINEQQRLQVAAQARGEAEKILRVKQAEGEAESKRLQGEGIARQREAIAKGIENSIATLKQAGVDPREATVMMLMTQWLDTLHAVGANTRSNTILLPHSPGAVGSLMQELMSSMLAAHDATTPPTKAATKAADGAGAHAAT